MAASTGKHLTPIRRRVHTSWYPRDGLFVHNGDIAHKRDDEPDEDTLDDKPGEYLDYAGTG
jgi:hypothetical protein